MKILELFFRFLFFWTPIARKYEMLKNDEERRPKSVTMGVRSIIQSVLCGIFTVLALIGLSFCIQNFTGNGQMPIFTIIGGVAAVVAAVALFINGVIGGLIYMVYQFKLNKRAIRWIALAVWLVVIVAVIVFAVILLGNLSS